MSTRASPQKSLLLLLVVAAISTLGLATPSLGSPLIAPQPGKTLLGFYSWDPETFAKLAGQHAVRWRTIDWDPAGNYGEDWPSTLAAAATGGWALQATWTSERYDAGLGRPVEVISPGAIARGEGDQAILEAASALRLATIPVILRLNPEMNGYWHSYCAVNADGSPRDADHSASAFVAAWRRIRTIFSGGSVSAVDAELTALGQPPLPPETSGDVGAPDVSFAWVPNVSANPATTSNTDVAGSYYPGDQYVDWTGVDIYDDQAGNADWDWQQSLLDSQYNAHPSKPFGFFEWGLLSKTDDAQFVNDALDWVDAHPRVELLDWYDNANSRLTSNPMAAAAYRARTQSSRYLRSWQSVLQAPSAPTPSTGTTPANGGFPTPPSSALPSPLEPPSVGQSPPAKQVPALGQTDIGGNSSTSRTSTGRAKKTLTQPHAKIVRVTRSPNSHGFAVSVGCVGASNGSFCRGSLTVTSASGPRWSVRYVIRRGKKAKLRVTLSPRRHRRTRCFVLALRESTHSTISSRRSFCG